MNFIFHLFTSSLIFFFIDDQTVLPNTIDLFDIKEIIRRLSGKRFNGAELTQIAEAVRSDKIRLKIR